MIIIGKEDFNYEDKLKFINKYACKLFRVKGNTTIKELKEKFTEFVKINNSKNETKNNKTLKDIIFNCSPLNNENENFLPFESQYLKSIILYIKINEIDDEKYIVIDKYNKYIEERKYIELNLIKTINYQYLHTLYHELNNPLNALLAIAGEHENEKIQIFSSDINNSRIYKDSPIIFQGKAIKSNKKINHHISLHNSNRAIIQNISETKVKKRNMIDNSILNNKIPLLVNIIKIFIKNFILYLKTRADNLLMLKNEFDEQKETSDIMNAVEVSEYEKQLTRHKSIKINLEYIFDLYFQKFLCLFQYKEVECETNFNKLRNIYVITDEFNFIYYIRQIYTYLYYVVPKKEGFSFQYIENEAKKTIKILIKKRDDSLSNKNADTNELNAKDNKSKMSQVIQTKEMTKEVLYYMSKRLNFVLEVYDSENTDLKNNNNINNIYLSVIIPFVKNDKSEEEDDFKDQDISEMIEKDFILLEEKLKRQFPNCNCDAFNQKKSHNSVNNNLELMRRNGKCSSEGSICLEKKENISKTSSIINSKNNINISYSDNHIKKIDIQNIHKESHKMPLENKRKNDKFLNKCLLSLDFKKHENCKTKSDNLLGVCKNKCKFKNHYSDKNVLYNEIHQKSEIECNIKKLSGVFTKINSLGFSEQLDINDMSISNNGFGIKREKEKEINIVKNRNSFSNLEINEKTKNSMNFKSKNHDLKNSKIKSSHILSDILERDNKKINLNISNNHIINIFSENSFHNHNIKNKIPDYMAFKKSQKEIHLSCKNKSKTNILSSLQEINKTYHKRLTKNIQPKINLKDCMTFFREGDGEGEKKEKESLSKEQNNILNKGINQNDGVQKSGSSNKENNQSEEESEESISLNQNSSLNKEQEGSQNNCNCLDILIVDDEQFNIMASQKMIQKLGFESDVAFNGEECLNLIKEKKKANCFCKRKVYKLIFLDIVMPILDGIKTAKKIQEMIDKKEIEDKMNIVFVSGNIDGNEIKESLLQIGCVKECLQKPMRIEKYQKIFQKYYKDI